MFNESPHQRSDTSREGQSPTAGLATATAFAAAVAAATHVGHLLFGDRFPQRPDDVVVFLAAVVLAVIAGWFVVNVAAWSVALRRGSTIRRFTLPGTRRLAQLLLAVSLSTACVAEPEAAPSMVLVEGEAPPSSIATSTTATPGTTLPPTVPLPTAAPTTAPTTAAPTTVAPTTVAEAPTSSRPATDAATETETTDPPEPEPQLDAARPESSITPHEVFVHAGDNLWSLSEEALQRHGNPAPSTAEVASYWRLVVGANEVRSGDPDLIAIGETIHMPAYAPDATLRTAADPPRPSTVAVR